MEKNGIHTASDFNLLAYCVRGVSSDLFRIVIKYILEMNIFISNEEIQITPKFRLLYPSHHKIFYKIFKNLIVEIVQ